MHLYLFCVKEQHKYRQADKESSLLPSCFTLTYPYGSLKITQIRNDPLGVLIKLREADCLNPYRPDLVCTSGGKWAGYAYRQNEITISAIFHFQGGGFLRALRKGGYKHMDNMIQDIRSREEEFIALLSDLIRFQTPAPPARNTEAIQAYITNYLKEIRFGTEQWDVYPGDPNVVGRLKGTSSDTYNSLILNGHIDVASVEEDENWKYAPFDPVVEGRTLYGRGAADMKGGLAACLFAMRLLYDYGVRLGGDVILQSVIGEEVGEAGTKQCGERGYTADYAIVADTSHCEIHGQGGVITGWITVKSPTTHHDGTRRQLIHAGGGVRGASAIEKMNKLLIALQELERHWAVTKSYPGFPPGTNTINPAVIEGGRHAAFIADECRLWITVHYYPDESAEQVAEEIELHLRRTAAADVWMKDNPPVFQWGGESMIVDRGEIFPSFSVDTAHPAFALLQESHCEAFGASAMVRMSETVTDGGWLAAYGIPTVCYGPGELKHAHAVDEQIDIDELFNYTASLLTFILKWCNTEKKK